MFSTSKLWRSRYSYCIIDPHAYPISQIHCFNRLFYPFSMDRIFSQKLRSMVHTMSYQSLSKGQYCLRLFLLSSFDDKGISVSCQTINICSKLVESNSDVSVDSLVQLENHLETALSVTRARKVRSLQISYFFLLSERLYLIRCRQNYC